MPFHTNNSNRSNTMKKQYTIKELLKYAAEDTPRINGKPVPVLAEVISEFGEQYNTTIWLLALGAQWHEDLGTNLMMYAYEDMSTEKCEMSSRQLIEKYEGTFFSLV